MDYVMCFFFLWAHCFDGLPFHTHRIPMNGPLCERRHALRWIAIFLHTDFWRLAEYEVRDGRWLARFVRQLAWLQQTKLSKAERSYKTPKQQNAKCPPVQFNQNIFGVVYNIKITCLVYVWRLCCCSIVCLCDVRCLRLPEYYSSGCCTSQANDNIYDKQEPNSVVVVIKGHRAERARKWEKLHRMRIFRFCMLIWLCGGGRQNHKEYLPRNGYCLRCVRG